MATTFRVRAFAGGKWTTVRQRMADLQAAKLFADAAVSAAVVVVEDEATGCAEYVRRRASVAPGGETGGPAADAAEINWCPRCGTETRPCDGNESGIQAVDGQVGCPVCRPAQWPSPRGPVHPSCY